MKVVFDVWLLMVQIVGEDDDRIVSDNSDLAAVSEKLRLVSIASEKEKEPEKQEETTSSGGAGAGNFHAGSSVTSDEELARMLQVLLLDIESIKCICFLTMNCFKIL